MKVSNGAAGPLRDHALHFAMITISGLIAACVLFVVTRQGADWTFITLSREVWVAILTSFAASALFALIAAISSAMALRTHTKESAFFMEVHDDLGILSGRPHRVDYLQEYQDLIRGAQRRIWALGVSNKAFLNTHRSSLLQKAREGVDIVIMFLDPEAQLTIGDAEGLPLLAAYKTLEGGGSKGSVTDIQARLGPLMSSASARALLVSAPTHFSCLVIDDNVFFFPFTAPSVSSHQPMLHVRADRTIGSAVVGHLKALMDAPQMCRAVGPLDPNGQQSQ